MLEVTAQKTPEAGDTNEYLRIHNLFERRYGEAAGNKSRKREGTDTRRGEEHGWHDHT